MQGAASSRTFSWWLDAWGWPLATFGAGLLVSLILRHLLLRALRPGTGHGRSALAVLETTLRVPSLLWSFVAALKVALEFADLSKTQERWVSGSIYVFLVASFSLVVASVLWKITALYSEQRGISGAASGLTRVLIHILVFGFSATLVLRHFDLTIAPLLTALGVGGLAVALALQDTLANFFAGVHILLEAPISVGDFVRLSTGEEGTVRDIGWRTTRVATTNNNMIVIPNTKITTGILVNFSLPEPQMAAELNIVAAVEADPDQLTAIALEEVVRVEGVLKDPPPLVLMDPGLLPTHLQMKLVFWVPQRIRAGLLASEIRFRMLRRMRAAKVPLPSVRPV